MYLLPEPIKMIKGNGTCTLPYYGRILLAVDTRPEDYQSAKLLKEALQKTLGFFWEIEKEPMGAGWRVEDSLSPKEVAIYLYNEGKNPEGKPASICHPEDEVESYRMEIAENGVTVIGKSSIGVWYGIQTLRQILLQEGAVLPFLQIEDKPELVNRGFYHDATRGRIPTMEEMKSMVDTLAFYKMNQFQLYVEHSFYFHEFSEVWRDDTPLTAEDIMELDQYCKERHVELVPSITSFGHLYKVLRTKKYSHLCELPDADKEEFSFLGRMAHHTVDVTNTDSFELVKQMLEEFMSLFTSPHFNLCADETFDLGKGRSKEKGEQVGVERLYMDFLKQVCELVAGHGRIPMFWGDIICAFPEAVKELPEGTICLNWGYAPKQTDESTRKLKEAGAIQYICPGVQGWNNLVNDMKGAYENIRRMCSYAHQYGAIGVLNTDWGDYGHINHPEFSRTGMIYGAAFSWNSRIPERENINRAISRIEYGDRGEKFVSLISDLQECSIFSWYIMVSFKERQQGRGGLEQERYSLDLIKWEKLPQAEERLFDLEQKLREQITELEERGRQRIYAYLLAAEGIHLFNQIGQTVRQRCCSELSALSGTEIADIPDTVQNALLASKLEHWYRRYRILWHTTSREAELYRIGEVINWYGDYLRS